MSKKSGWTEDRGQRTEGRGEKDRVQRTEYRGQRREG